MLKEIDDLLQAWALWRARSEDSGLGYKPSSINMAMSGCVGGGGGERLLPYGVDQDQVLSTVDGAVVSLPKVHMLVVLEWYCRSGTQKAKAAGLGIRCETLSKYLRDAHMMIEKWIRKNIA